jgi:CubicO group peptidase (beta-lactamase class C family)
MSIALLAQQGKLSLDDDIRKYVPEMPKYDETVHDPTFDSSYRAESVNIRH